MSYAFLVEIYGCFEDLVSARIKVEMLTSWVILPSGTVAWFSALLNLIVVTLSRRMVL